MKRNSVWKIFFLFLLWKPSKCFITFIEPRSPLQGHKAAPGSPWPMPRLWKNSSSVVSLHPGFFKITSNLKSCDLIESAIGRYGSLLFPGHHPRRQFYSLDREIYKLQLTIQSQECEVYPSFDSDESYELQVTRTKIRVTAQTTWGALRGLETFSQLVYQNKQRKFVVNETDIKDKPRFQHRGILLDTARHFIPLHLILTNLDAMAYNKMNVFHWHLVDDQSFPYESKTFPQLSKKGSYSRGRTYSQSDVKRVIEYARKRGIRVIPEFDSPGHTFSWGKAFPALLTACYVGGHRGRANYTQHHSHEVLDPIKESTYKFLGKLFKEINETFPDDYIHLGMDEVYYACWKSNPDIVKFMRQKGFGSEEFSKLEEYFMERVLKIVKKLKSKPIIWQDPIENGALPTSETLVQIWKDKSLWDVYAKWQDYSTMVADKGYKMVLSSCWYLNYINYGPDWEAFYTCEPLNFTDDPHKQRMMVGGEACMWSEYVDSTNIISRIWPRASAVAERLWSAPEVNNVKDAQFRLDQQRCRLLRRGISAQPILNGFCEDESTDFSKKMAVVWSCAERSPANAAFLLLVITSHYFV